MYGVGVAARSVVMAVGTAVGLRWFARPTALAGARGSAGRFLPTIVVAAAIVIVAPFIVPIVLGDDFAPSVPVVQVGALVGLLSSVDFLSAARDSEERPNRACNPPPGGLDTASCGNDLLRRR